LEEANVVLREQTKVLNTVFEVGDTFYAKTEGVACVYLRINTARFEYIRVNHTATKDLYPTCTLAERTTLATAEVARNIHFSGRFCEWEITWTKTYLGLRTEHLLGKVE
jgi:hypothetical protein